MKPVMASSSSSSALAKRTEAVPDHGRPHGGRADRIAKATLLALAVAFALAVVAGDGLGRDVDAGPRLGGDYPAFHAAGSIVLAGDVDQLYDAGRQQAEQAGLGIGGYLAFAYPPHVAVAYAPLAALGFRAGYAFHTLLMVVAVAVAVRLLQRPVATLRGLTWPAIAATVTFYPLFKAVGGGQNTALTLLAFATVWWALHGDREGVAGVAIGLLLFRPQYALPLIGLLALDRRWRAVAVAGATGALTWAVTAAFLGKGWLVEWIDSVVPFVETDAEVNAANSISLLGFGQAVLGPDHPVALTLGILGGVAVVATLAWIWRPQSVTSLAVRMGATAAGVLLLSPHTMFYDAGLLVVTVVAVVATTPVEQHRSLLAPLASIWALGFVHVLGSAFGATPLVALVVAAFGLMVARAAVAEPIGVVADA